MNIKVNYEYVKNKVKELSNGESELLTKKECFVNKDTPLTLTCKCGNTFQTKYAYLRKIAFQCEECRNKNASAKYRLNFDDVKKYIKSKGCEYVSGNYINNLSILTLKCKCGKIFKKKFVCFKSKGQNRCPDCGKERIRKSKIKYTENDAKKILAQKGITLLSKYINSYHPIECICSKGHKFTTRLQFVLYNKFGCLECSKNYHIGQNSSNYKGGESEVLDNFRKIIKDWKYQVAKKYNFVCALTGAKYDCVVHHLIPFKTIVEQSCQELNIPLHRNLKDYAPDDYKKLENLVLKKHTLDVGILLQRKVHKKFHSIYGLKSTNIEQFNEFVKKYYP